MIQVLEERPYTAPQTALSRKNPEAQSVTAMAVEDHGEFANLLDTSKFGHLQRVATLFASSQLVPQHFQGNVANCFIAMQMAMRLRVDPFMFMQSCYIVHGRPGMEAKLAIALINSSGLFTDSLDYEIEGGIDPKASGYRVRAFAVRKSTGKRVDGPWVDWPVVRAEGWDAKQGSKWKTIPLLMFQYRAAAFFGRLHCPERLMGMQTVDELRDTEVAAAPDLGSVHPDRASALLAKITTRPVSEGQTLEPTPEASAQAQAEIAHEQSPTVDTQEPDVSGIVDAEAPEAEAKPVDVPTFADYESFLNSMREEAMSRGVQETDMLKMVNKAAALLGKKGKESQISKDTLRLWYVDFVEGKGHFDRS